MSNQSNNGRENKIREGELEFKLSETQTYNVTFVEKPKGKSRVDELRTKGKAKGKDKSRDKGRRVAKLKGEYIFSPKTIAVEMDEEDIRELAKDPNVLKIEPDVLLEPCATYEEPYHQNADWVLEKTGAKTAFANGISGQGVKVAVLDSGVDINNPLLKHAIKGGTSVVDWSNDYIDKTGHGTMVAGAIAGKNQGKPYGVAPDVDLYAVKITVSETDGRASTVEMTMGMEWAIANGMQAINISFQPSNFVLDSYLNAVDRARSLGIPIFHSAGNANEDIDNRITVCGLDGINCVLALDKKDYLASFSAFGDERIAFSTYGYNVPVAISNSTNPSTANGTSFSSPIAMGIFSLYKSKFPNANGNQVLEMMKTNSRNVSIYNHFSMAGIPVFLNDAVLYAQSALSKPTLTLVSVTGNTAILRATVPTTSAPFDKLVVKNSWSDDKVITLKNKTRYYEFAIKTPAFGTQYESSIKVLNGNLESVFSNVLTFTTTSEITYESPINPVLEYVDNDGLDVTFRVKVPDGSPTFNIVEVDTAWAGEDKTLNISHTRSHEFVVRFPSYNNTNSLNVRVYNGGGFGTSTGYFGLEIPDENSTDLPMSGKLSVVSIVGKTVRLRIQLPNLSAMMDGLSIWNYQNDNSTTSVINFTPKTRVHEFDFEAPDYNTEYRIFVFPYNGEVGGYGSNSITYTTGSNNGGQPIQKAPDKPLLSLVSVSGKTATIRATVPNTSAEFNKLELDYYWITSFPDQTITTANTRSYDFTVTAPEYNTSYTLDARAFNGELSSTWSTALTFTTETEPVVQLPPAKPELSLISINGKAVTIRATVPSTSATFNKLELDYYWISGYPDVTLTMPDTRSYDFTITVPEYSASYTLDAKVSNGTLGSNWSSQLSFISGQAVSIAPEKPTISLVSVDGKTITIRTTVPASSVEFNKIDFDYRWIAGYPDETVSMPKTRSYDKTFQVPNFNTNYTIDVKVYNDNLGSSWSTALEFTSGADTTPVAPSNPSLSLVSVNGKTVTVRATVPNTSAPFNKLQFDYYWVAGVENRVVTMASTRSYDLTFEAPEYNTTYALDFVAFNGEFASNWSTALSFKTGAGNNVVVEDFSDNIFNFNFSGTWVRDTASNTFRSAYSLGHSQASATIFNVDGGTNGGQLSIDYKTSSEQNWDKLNIYLNDVLLVTESGVNNFKTLTANIPSGRSIVKLEYVKDVSVSMGDDAGYIDNIRVVKF